MLYIFNQGTFNFHHIPQLFLNNYSLDMLSYINTNINTNINANVNNNNFNNINTNIFNNNNLFFMNRNIYMNSLLSLLRK